MSSDLRVALALCGTIHEVKTFEKGVFAEFMLDSYDCLLSAAFFFV